MAPGGTDGTLLPGETNFFLLFIVLLRTIAMHTCLSHGPFYGGQAE